MIIQLAALLLDAEPASIVGTQRRLDQLVNGCAATKVVHLTAESATEVLIFMQNDKRAPTDEEDRQFTCVLEGMWLMSDLHFGFLGNAASDDEQR